MRNNWTLILDFDGTIADTLPFTFSKVVEIVRQLKITDKTDQQVIEAIRSQPYHQLMRDFNISWLKLPWILSVIKKAQYELLGQIDKVKPIAGIKTTLNQLKKNGLQLGILSSNIKKTVERFLTKNQLNMFDFVECESNLFGKDKAILTILRKHKLEKEKVVYIGDELRDVEACKKITVPVVAVTWGLNTRPILKKARPDFIINKPAELVKIFLADNQKKV